ncbi:MAG: hypothetical protein ACOWWM_15295 [Desulfobacterales bacterium]
MRLFFNMSGFGIHVAKLYECAGWSMSGTTRVVDGGEVKLSSVCGLVLLG